MSWMTCIEMLKFKNLFQKTIVIHFMMARFNNKRKRDLLHDPLSRSWNFEESEYLAENELITIVPEFSFPKMQFMTVSDPPF